MKGRKITRAEFVRNYVNVDESEINKPVADIEIQFVNDDKRVIYNPITLFYYKAIGETEKAICFQFEDASEQWFSKQLLRVDTKKKEVIIPRNFAEERNLLEFEVKNAK